jgi:hypothetical protein
MALITIPTSIAGINIPSGLLGGPLGSLYAGAGPDFVQYPRDLGSSTRSHSVFFTIEEVKEITLEGIKKGISKTIGTVGAGLSAFSETSDYSLYNKTDAAAFATESKTSLGNLGSEVDAADQATQETSGFANYLKERKGDIVSHISLYMPENFSLSSAASYDSSTTLASAAGAIPYLSRVVSKFTNVIENQASRVILNKAGYVFNPQKQMLFQGIDFRTFDMSFTFTPYSAKEAEDVKQIIKMFRKWSAPATSTAFAGMFFVPPAFFNIDFRFQGKTNPNLPRLQKCVVESIDVNYAPNGWAAHTDGAPVQTTITITFKELFLVDRASIEAGY